MPVCGGFAPFPRRFGGGTPALRLILDGLNAARGTAYDTTIGSNVWVENMAFARAIWAEWETNQRLANQFDPARTTSMLPRWEAIFGVSPDPTATPPQRRAVLVDLWSRVGVAFTTGVLTTNLTAILGSAFVALTHETVSSATMFWPGGTPSTSTPWYSTIDRLVIQVTQPSGMLDGAFYQLMNTMGAMLDQRLPVWCTWSWWRTDANTGTKGFFLDSPRNLDNDAFDI